MCVSERIESCRKRDGLRLHQSEMGSLQEISHEYSDTWSLNFSRYLFFFFMTLYFHLADGQGYDGGFDHVPQALWWLVAV